MFTEFVRFLLLYSYTRQQTHFSESKSFEREREMKEQKK